MERDCVNAKLVVEDGKSHVPRHGEGASASEALKGIFQKSYLLSPADEEQSPTNSVRLITGERTIRFGSLCPG